MAENILIFTGMIAIILLIIIDALNENFHFPWEEDEDEK